MDGSLVALDGVLSGFAGAYRDKADAYRLGLAALDRAARRRHNAPFAGCDPEQQDDLI